MKKVMNGTTYSEGTPDAVIETLEKARHQKTRIRIEYGNPEKKKSWYEVHDIRGYVGRSTGSEKIPILLPTKRSMGGDAIMPDRILSIRENAGSKLLYTCMGIHDDNSIREWYTAYYPEDPEGKNIKTSATFSALPFNLHLFYTYTGVFDTIIRQRIFAEYAMRKNKTYDYIHNLWLEKDQDHAW